MFKSSFPANDAYSKYRDHSSILPPAVIASPLTEPKDETSFPISALGYYGKYTLDLTNKTESIQRQDTESPYSTETTHPP